MYIYMYNSYNIYIYCSDYSILQQVGASQSDALKKTEKFARNARHYLIPNAWP